MKWLDFTKSTLLIILLICLGYPTVLVMAESQVTGSKKQEEPKKVIRITSDRLESGQKTGWVEFIGNVKATQDDIVITADRMKVFHKSGGDKEIASGTIEKIIAQGNVKIVFDNQTKTAMADKGVYLADQKVLELSEGDPRVWSGKNMIRGKKITLFQAENRTLIEGDGEDQVEATLSVEKGKGLSE